MEKAKIDIVLDYIQNLYFDEALPLKACIEAGREYYRQLENKEEAEKCK